MSTVVLTTCPTSARSQRQLPPSVGRWGSPSFDALVLVNQPAGFDTSARGPEALASGKAPITLTSEPRSRCRPPLGPRRPEPHHLRSLTSLDVRPRRRRTPRASTLASPASTSRCPLRRPGPGPTPYPRTSALTQARSELYASTLAASQTPTPLACGLGVANPSPPCPLGSRRRRGPAFPVSTLPAPASHHLDPTPRRPGPLQVSAPTPRLRPGGQRSGVPDPGVAELQCSGP